MNGFPLRDAFDPRDSRIFPLSNLGEPADLDRDGDTDFDDVVLFG